MLYRTHLLFAVLATFISFQFFHPIHLLLFVTSVLFFSLVPDLDHPSSYLSRKLFFFRPLAWLFDHRGFMHSFFFASILYALAFHFEYSDVGYGILVGYAAHLLSDGLTKHGVRLFYPVSTFTLRGFITTGGFLEKIIFWLLAAVLLYFTVTSL